MPASDMQKAVAMWEEELTNDTPDRALEQSLFEAHMRGILPFRIVAKQREASRGQQEAAGQRDQQQVEESDEPRRRPRWMEWPPYLTTETSEPTEISGNAGSANDGDQQGTVTPPLAATGAGEAAATGAGAGCR